MPELNQDKPYFLQFLALFILTIILIIGAKTIGKRNVAQPLPVPSNRSTDAVATPIPNSKATIITDKGEMTIELFDQDAPKTVENFKRLSQNNYYNGVIFHRVIKDFMIQTGDPTGTGTGGESVFGGEFADEINSHQIDAGTLAMANRGPNTNGSQFFIVTEKAQPHLDGKHTVFGRVVTGMDVVKAIANVEIDEAKNHRPLQDVRIVGIRIE